MTAFEIINEFRRQNGATPFYGWNPVENNNCESHCWAMVQHGCYHAPEYLRPGKAEAVGIHGWTNNFDETLSRIIFDLMGRSPGHKSVLLMDNLAAGVIVWDWKVFITVRGW